MRGWSGVDIFFVFVWRGWEVGRKGKSGEEQTNLGLIANVEERRVRNWD